MTPRLRNWLAIGAGIGIEIDGHDILVTAVRVRFQRVSLLGEYRILNFDTRPAAAWGIEYSNFVRQHDLTHLAAYVVLSRDSVSVRFLSLPPIKGKEMDAAVRFQSDSLHPYAEDEATYAWCRLSRPGDILVAIARRQTVEQYSTLFAEAGIEVASFTVSAAVFYSAVRLLSPPKDTEFAAYESSLDGTELYGESPAKAVFSAFVDSPLPRLETYARSELRIGPDREIIPIRALLPTPETADREALEFRSSRTFAAALCAATPWFAVRLNLLPAELRRSNSRLLYVPTAVLAGLLIVCAVALAAESSWEQRKYLAQLNQQTAQLEAGAARSQALDKQIEKTIEGARQIDAFRRRSKADLDVLNELTRILPPPSFLNNLDVTRSNVVMYGQAVSATGLLKMVDASPLFRNSSFMTAIGRTADGDLFRLRADRKAGTQ